VTAQDRSIAQATRIGRLTVGRLHEYLRAIDQDDANPDILQRGLRVLLMLVVILQMSRHAPVRLITSNVLEHVRRCCDDGPTVVTANYDSGSKMPQDPILRIAHHDPNEKAMRKGLDRNFPERVAWSHGG